jgi:hypothetical protein
MIESTRNINSFWKCRQLKASISRKSGFTERDGSNRKFTFPHTTITRQVTTDNNTTLEAQNPLKERNYVTIKGGSACAERKKELTNKLTAGQENAHCYTDLLKLIFSRRIVASWRAPVFC